MVDASSPDRIEELTADLIIEGIVGTAIAARPEKARSTRSPVSAGRILEVRNLHLERKLHGISFSLEKGEILGVVGLSGSGISDLGKVIFGIEPPTSGEIIFEGKPIAYDSPRTAVRLGIGYVPKNRKEEGLVPGMAVADNIALPSLRAISRGLLISRRMRASLVSPIMELTDIRPMNLELSAESFSGGNQQKLGALALDRKRLEAARAGRADSRRGCRCDSKDLRSAAGNRRPRRWDPHPVERVRRDPFGG